MALRMYQRARDKKALTREIVDNYVAMALFTCRKYEECEAILRLMPEKAYYKFNLALTLHEHAIFIFSQ